jgi:hypothetical protein
MFHKFLQVGEVMARIKDALRLRRMDDNAAVLMLLVWEFSRARANRLGNREENGKLVSE